MTAVTFTAIQHHITQISTITIRTSKKIYELAYETFLLIGRFFYSAANEFKRYLMLIIEPNGPHEMYFSQGNIQNLPRTINQNPVQSPSTSISSVRFDWQNDLKINQRSLAKQPTIFDLENIKSLLTQTSPPIQYGELLSKFDETFPLNAYDLLSMRGYNPITKYIAKNLLQTQFINLINLDSCSGYMKNITEEIGLYIKGIIFYLRDQTIPKDKKKEAFHNLIRASENCVPRRHTEAMQTYKELSNQIETIENSIYLMLQNFKEQLFINHYSRSTQTPHLLNWIRKTVGQELGLDCNPIHKNDPYLHLGAESALAAGSNTSDNTKQKLLNTFQRLYTPKIIIENMTRIINERLSHDRDFQRELSSFLHNEIINWPHFENQDQKDRIEDMLPEPFQDENYNIKEVGVLFLLVKLDILNEKQPGMWLKNLNL